MNRFKRLAGHQGFSLIELMVVLVILGVITIAAFGSHQTAKRTTFTQEELVEVQHNLRFALEQMARDIRMSGFLIPDGDTPLSAATANSLTLQAASSKTQVARINTAFTSPSNPSTTQNVTIAWADMVDLFDVGHYVRILRPSNNTQPLDRVLEITAKDNSVPRLTLSGFTQAVQFQPGDMIVRVFDGNTDEDSNPNTSAPAHPNTVTYALVDDPDSTDANMHILQRSATGTENKSIASKISALEFSYLLDNNTETSSPSASQRESIRAVRITLTGETDTTQTGAADISGVRTRAFSHLVRIRNR